MNKLIAVWGSPHSGKTVFSIKLAKAIYDMYKARVVVLFTDTDVPTLPVILPNKKRDELFSVGKVLSRIDITDEDVLRNIVFADKKENFGILGYIDGENQFTYPKYNKEKASSFIDVLCSLAHYVIVDCVSNLENNNLANTAINKASDVFRLITPDPASIVWYLSQISTHETMSDHIQGINIPNIDVCVPTGDIRTHTGDMSFTLPFCRDLKQQYFEGKLFENIKDKKWSKTISAIAQKVVEE